MDGGAERLGAPQVTESQQMPAYVPPHLRKQQQGQQGQPASAGRSLADLQGGQHAAAGASDSARWGRAAALGAPVGRAGESGRRWDTRSGGGGSCLLRWLVLVPRKSVWTGILSTAVTSCLGPCWSAGAGTRTIGAARTEAMNTEAIAMRRAFTPQTNRRA